MRKTRESKKPTEKKKPKKRRNRRNRRHITESSIQEFEWSGLERIVTDAEIQSIYGIDITDERIQRTEEG